MNLPAAVRAPIPLDGGPRMRCPKHGIPAQWPAGSFPAHGWVARPEQGADQLTWCSPAAPAWDRSTGRIC